MYNKEGCQSINYIVEERQYSRRQFISGYKYAQGATLSNKFNAFLATLESAEKVPIGPVVTAKEEDNIEYLAYYFLIDSAFLYYLNLLLVEEPEEINKAIADIFLLKDRYFCYKFQNIMPDIDIAKYSTVGYNQYLAFRQKDLKVSLDSLYTNKATIRFGKRLYFLLKGITTIIILLRDIIFYIINISTSFLLSIIDIDTLSIFL